MKKIINKISFALVGLIVSVPAFAENGMCEALIQLHDVFNVLRTMAFIGAAFYIAGWAWEFISAGKVDMAKVKERGIGLLVGFSLLFMIGLLLSFIMSASGANFIGCTEVISAW